jgi:flavin reductase (DIM6/NTAB) family NADH-FMN oxidoreductase RutF
VLAADQMDISNHFASDGDKPFTGIDYRDGIGGCPVLSGNAAQFECRAWQQYDGGDHLILVGEVMNFEQHEKQPLVFAAGAYARLASQEAG